MDLYASLVRLSVLHAPPIPPAQPATTQPKEPSQRAHAPAMSNSFQSPTPQRVTRATIPALLAPLPHFALPVPLPHTGTCQRGNVNVWPRFTMILPMRHVNRVSIRV